MIVALAHWSTGARAPKLLDCGRQGRAGSEEERRQQCIGGGGRSVVQGPLFISFMFKVVVFRMNLYNESYPFLEKLYVGHASSSSLDGFKIPGPFHSTRSTKHC